MKILTIILAILSLTRAEPPVPSEYLIATQYLPPQTRNQYLPPQNKYLPPSTSASYKYLPPSTSYGTPIQTQPALKYGSSITPNTSYGQQSVTYPIPSKVYGATSTAYGNPGRSYGLPGASYGDPKAVQSTVPISNYGVAKSGYSDQSEPVNYEFEYHVQDAQSGNDFGHREQKQGNVAQGKYFVLLPDGRLQTVEYTADEEGYKPKISYQQVDGGYPLTGYPTKTEGYQY